jgi:Helix-turn-helix domain
VGSYTITFTPDDVSNASAVVRVDLGAAGARITELTVRAGSGDGLVPGELPGFDLGRLMRAIAPAGPAAPAFELSATPATIAPYEPAPAAVPARGTAGRRAADRAATKRTASKRTAAKQAPAKQAPAKKAAKAAAGKGAAAAAGGRASKRAGAAATRTTARGGARGQGTGRAYRRTPEDIVEVFNQAPSATALARHYGVPRHTVQGWLRRLRSEGVLPPSSRSAA